MTSVLFRTNAGKKSGLGHLTRCLELARELERQGAFCSFAIDTIEESIADFIGSFTTHCLYDSPPDSLNEREDAKKFLHICASKKIDWIIVDDYRIAQEWENLVSAKGYKICVIDDLERCHTCDALIDMKWCGPKTESRYEGKVPAHCKKMLGPQYALLNRTYKNQTPEKCDTFNIMLSLGGSGDLNILNNLINPLKKALPSAHIYALIGPLSLGKDKFIAEFTKDDFVTPLVGITDIYPYLKHTHLFIGAAGGTLYQIRALNIPAFTFSIASNQHTNISNLEDIGHHFHINEIIHDYSKVANFAAKIATNYQRIKELGSEALVPIDACGCQRVCNGLLTGRISPPALRHRSCVETTLSVEHTLRPCIDKDINHYLNSRNLPANRQNMTSVSEINRIDHFCWWFDAKRENFLLKKKGKPCLYIWHEQIMFEQLSFLVGGWFVCSEQTDFQDALIALNWQLEHCDKINPDVPWIAVINKHNKYVKLMNDYVGFKEIDPHHPYYQATANYFKDADPKEFHYVIREPQAQASTS
ncbi:MAG: UDP-2,4-diacetamido-2,4,6-trideoxy-beta-L-altropyranose hydrolase [Methylocystaceae bacterium]|nr:UDP-2,4-diacetamido-2,4,6-trideoxy-beta-L-altropyranose hydrolase [Methylocystaceae bacterium]